MSAVGVIGGGAAGLCAARHLLAAGMKPQVWEAAAGLGGTWRYSPCTGTDKHGIPVYSSMYNNLRTNLPKEVMAFPDFSFPSTEPTSFLHHSAVNQYLTDYANHFKLHSHIKTEHHVEAVEAVERSGGATGWSVTVRNLQQGATTSHLFDALVVCSGHYSSPVVPQLPGVEGYEGRQLHSHDYRHPQPFTDARVLVLGAGASGIDIAMELASVAKKVYLSHNLPSPIASDLPDNLQQVKGATEATTRGFVLADGSHVEADAILYCTGYRYSFPFLTKSCRMKVEDSLVTPLYKHIFNATFPSMAFIGIPLQICPFPMFDIQARFVTNVLTGKVTLPNPAHMLETSSRELSRHQQEGRPLEDFHLMALDQWEYMRELTEQAGEKMVPPVVQELFNAVRKLRNRSLLTYKNTNYRLTGPESYEVS